MSESGRYPLFSVYGVELEYMIVRSDSLEVHPVTDKVLHAVAGAYEAEVEMGELAWSNELVLHVIELKTNGPVRSLHGLADLFQRDLGRIQAFLGPLNGRMMPTGAHPWMDPHTDTRLWPHEQNAIYDAFDRIFSCRGHGWSNLQSVHLNLPFANDDEFGRLHAAVRVLLPLMPALAASSPFLDGRATGLMDARLEAYRRNAARIFSVSGHVIPERVYTRERYETEILNRIYRDMAPFDPEGVLRHEWVNARGAIARFDRNTIEIRVLDVQECPAADLAVIHLITETLKLLCAERWTSLKALQAWDERALETIMLQTIKEAETAVLNDAAYAGMFGLKAPVTVGALWAHVSEHVPAPEDNTVARAQEHILRSGTLARRLTKVIEEHCSRAQLHGIYSSLCDHLSVGWLFGERL
jgi:glutamate---cysteine ligase / carboxylate-amine ligase